MESEKHLARTRVALVGRPGWLRAPLSRYLFGPAPTSVVAWDALLAEIDRLGGVVAPSDVMRVTGLRRPAAEALLCKLVAEHEGDVSVEGTAVLYRLPRLARRRLAPMRGQVPPPVWEQRRQPDALTGNRPPIDAALLLVNLLVMAAGAAVAARGLGPLQAGLAFFFFVAAVFVLAMPLARVLRRRAHLDEVAAENGRRALLRAVLVRPPGRALGAHALSHAWIAASGRSVGQRRLFDEVLALGGEPDVDSKARLFFRFPDLDHEARALGQLRP